MGRTSPEVQLSKSVSDEVALARAVDDAVAQVTAAPDVAEQDLLGEIERVLNDMNGAFGPAVGAALPGVQEQAVALDGVEVTQEVQGLDHSVPLIAGKATIVRAYLSYPQAVSVRGELQVARSAAGPWQAVASLGPAQLDPSRSGSAAAQLRSRRATLDFSLNFLLPAELTAAGDVWLRMGPIQRTTGTPLPSLAALTTRTVEFRRAAPLRLRLVRVRYRMGSPPRTHEPSGTDVALLTSWLRRAYPIGTLELTTTTVDATPSPPFHASLINAQLIALRAVDVATGTDRRTHYYGVVADSGFFMQGLASDVPTTPRPGTVASGPAGPGTYNWDFDGSYGDWYGGHELGHTFGRFHAMFCGAAAGAAYPFANGQLSDADERFVGIDVGDPALGLPLRIMRGTTSHDVMTYCDDQWLSSFTYSGIFARMTAEDALAAGPISTGAAGMASPVGACDGAEDPPMRLIAALNITRTSGAITAVLPLTGATDADDEDGARRAGPYDVTVRIRDAEGVVVDERPAAFVPSACEDPGDEVTGTVDMDLPVPTGAASVEVLVDGRVVDSQSVGGEAVAPGAIAGSSGAAAGPGGPSEALELRWDQQAGAPAGQRYIVQLSDDVGGSWRTIAVGLAEPAVSVPLEELVGDEVTVRVLATTGTGPTEMRSETIRVR